MLKIKKFRGLLFEIGDFSKIVTDFPWSKNQKYTLISVKASTKIQTAVKSWINFEYWVGFKWSQHPWPFILPQYLTYTFVFSPRHVLECS